MGGGGWGGGGGGGGGGKYYIFNLMVDPQRGLLGHLPIPRVRTRILERGALEGALDGSHNDEVAVREREGMAHMQTRLVLITVYY